MKLKTFDHLNCSLAQALSVIGEHWTLLILRDAFFGLRRFDEFQKSLGIARNVLSARLKRLVASGVLEKTAVLGHSEYRLTEKGLALQPVMIAMTHWGDAYMPHPNGVRVQFVDRKLGKPVRRMAVYAADGRRLGPKQVRGELGPGLLEGGRAARPKPRAVREH